MNGERLNALSVDDLQYFETRFFLVPGTGTVYVDAKLSVIRQRAVGDGFHEELTILNHDDKPVDLDGSHRRRLRLRRPVRGQGRAEKKGKYLNRVETAAPRLGYERDKYVRDDVDLGDGPGEARQERPDLHGRSSPTARGRPSWTSSRRPGLRRAARAAEVRAGPRPAEHGAEPRAVARGRAAARVRLGAAQGDVPAQPRRPRRAALLAARRRRAQPARRGPALVHDDVRPRQHLHEPAGAAVHSRARGDDAASARRAGRDAASTTSATRIRAGSSTRCATAR